MATISLAEFRDDTVVVHFGGDFAAIDAYTLAYSLLGFADTARAVSAAIDPGQEIEILVEATGPGSYRTVIRRVRKGLGGFFSEGTKAVFWGIVATLIWETIIKSEPKPQITINTGEVIIQHGTDRIIVPRHYHDAAQNAQKSPDVQEGLRRTFEPLEANPRISEFALTTHLEDPVPAVSVPRDLFPRIVHVLDTIDETRRERLRSEHARLVILKAWLKNTKRKWLFEWNGVPISAPIADKEFLEQISKRKYLLGSGDALDVEITFKQHFDPELKVYVNDTKSFVVAKVFKIVPSS